MKTMQEAYGRTIQWAGIWKYQLRAGQDVIGLLQLEGNGGMQAVAESADGRWIFSKKWFPSEKVILRAGESDRELAVLQRRLMEERSSLVFTDGHIFYWKPTNVWRNNWVFTNEFGEVLLHFKRRSNPLTALIVSKGESKGSVDVEHFAFYMKELPLLTLLGCYLMVLDGI